MAFAYSFVYGYAEVRKYVDRLVEFAPKYSENDIVG